MNGSLPLGLVRTLQELYERSMARTTFTLVMLAIDGSMALLLAAALVASYVPARRAAALDPVEALRAE